MQTVQEKIFSIIIPSWNNLPLLKLCIASIRKNSAYPHQIIIHVNEGIDGTLEWVKTENLQYTTSAKNIGVCYSVNQASILATETYIVFMNDDMYCCPGWDSALLKAIAQLDTNFFILSGTMIEPIGTSDGSTVVSDFGHQADTFNEEGLLAALPNLLQTDWNGTAQPTILHREWWFKMGGYSIEFSPGMGSDNDLCMKMWLAGCRIFRSIGASKVYHFVQKTTGRIKPNNSRLQFMKKWGISTSMFHRYYLRCNTKATNLKLPEPELSLSYRWNWFRIHMTIIWATIKEAICIQ